MHEVNSEKELLYHEANLVLLQTRRLLTDQECPKAADFSEFQDQVEIGLTTMHTLERNNVLALLELSEERYLIIHHAQECFLLQRILMIEERLNSILVRFLVRISCPLCI